MPSGGEKIKKKLSFYERLFNVVILMEKKNALSYL